MGIPATLPICSANSVEARETQTSFTKTTHSLDMAALYTELYTIHNLHTTKQLHTGTS